MINSSQISSSSMSTQVPTMKIGWTCFYIGVTAVAFGSSYYHLHPNDAALLWDRLPVRSCSFSSLYDTAFVCFVLFLITGFAWFFDLDDYCIVPFLLAGLVSILYWRFFDDFIPYALV
ncbi:unnamed protein product [Arabidopsis lyrata]|uniref:Uncharacterized protein n=1 Tax=Arabidopsis lyrata subsp. lyrata TaxID=81972 RepID=D7L044_ARALL|nr:hypothetical protein ARALYDRAFT_899593 [Arabidopsis lyrata subsp. lyrata]CAH8262158.1 unnamed protein product [Arabidopsis lyrata]